MHSRVLYLVRHGQHERLSPDEVDGGSEDERSILADGGLTKLGRKQAKLTARRLCSHPISAIYCSSLPRALQTAEIMAKEFPGVALRKSRILWECIPSVPAFLSASFSGMSSEEIGRARGRAEGAYVRYFKAARTRDKHEILVCHGNLIRYFVSRALGAGPDAWANMGSFNCGISEVWITHDRKVVMCHNDCGHLPGDLRT
jgi:serine/threonine-protein phosphatase PGAM5